MATTTAIESGSSGSPRSSLTRVITVGSSLKIDLLSRDVLLDGEPVVLSNKEFSLLRVLASDPTRVFTRQELYAFVWGISQRLPTRTLDSHAARLRSKLTQAGHRFVFCHAGVGYKLIDALPPEAISLGAGTCPTCGQSLARAA